MSSIVSFSIFNGVSSGHGGQKRTWQIQKILSNSFPQTVILPFNYSNPQKIPLRSKIRSIGRMPVRSAIRNFSFDQGVGKILDQSYWAVSQMRALGKQDAILKDCETVIWENNFPEFFYLPHFVKERYRKRVVACPHNLESLISHARFTGGRLDKLKFLSAEMNALSICDEVFTISEEEQWLLNLFGIRSKYLPYYPLGELYNSLLEIRHYRSMNVSEDFFLVVGSASNPPTKVGMVELLEQIQKHNRHSKPPYKVKVIGYGTEVLLQQFNCGDIEVHGYAEDRILNEALRKCKAVIINQGYSTGALTKISELLVAGIPVIADSGGARSFRRTPGLSVFDSLAELDDHLSGHLLVPPIPELPTKEFEAFKKICTSD